MSKFRFDVEYICSKYGTTKLESYFLIAEDFNAAAKQASIVIDGDDPINNEGCKLVELPEEMWQEQLRKNEIRLGLNS